MIIQTKRLVIREVTIADIHNIHALHSLPETDEFNTSGIPETVQATEKVIAVWLAEQKQDPKTSYVFCIDTIATKQFAGLIDLNSGRQHFRSAETWYKIHVEHWNKGYATEALINIISFGFNRLQLHRIEAGCAVENIASAKVLEKAGMIKEGMKRKNLPIRGLWKDAYSYAIIEDDFFNV